MLFALGDYFSLFLFPARLLLVRLAVSFFYLFPVLLVRSLLAVPALSALLLLAVPLLLLAVPLVLSDLSVPAEVPVALLSLLPVLDAAPVLAALSLLLHLLARERHLDS